MTFLPTLKSENCVSDLLAGPQCRISLIAKIKFGANAFNAKRSSFGRPPPSKNRNCSDVRSVLWFDRLGDRSSAPEVVTLPVKPRWASVNISR